MTDLDAEALLQEDSGPVVLTPDTTIAGLPVLNVTEREDYVKALIYGQPGVGKTYLCGSASIVESMKPVLFIDIEGGIKPVAVNYPDVDVIRVKDEFTEVGGRVKLVKTSWERLQDVYEELRKGVKYRTVVIDSLTEAQKMSMYSVMARTVQSDPSRDVDIPAQRDWGKSGEMVRRMVRAFRDLDCNVLFTALEDQIKDQMSGRVTVTPSLPGKLKFEITAFFDLVLYMYVKTERDGDQPAVKRYVLSSPTDKYIAKDRSGKLPMTLEGPNMQAVAELYLS